METSVKGLTADWGADHQCRVKYRQFVERVFDKKGAWILVSSDGPLETKVADDQWALSLWTSERSAVEFAKLKELEREFRAEFIPLDELTERAIPDLIDAKLQIHPNPQDPPIGLFVPPEGFRSNIYLLLAGSGEVVSQSGD